MCAHVRKGFGATMQANKIKLRGASSSSNKCKAIKISERMRRFTCADLRTCIVDIDKKVVKTGEGITCQIYRELKVRLTLVWY